MAIVQSSHDSLFALVSMRKLVGRARDEERE